MGIVGNKQLWETLRDLVALAERLPDVDFNRLIERAEWQCNELDAFRARTGTKALARHHTTPL